MANIKEYLPKCILARIDKYWYPTLPIDYPKSSSIFDFVEGTDKAAVITMEENIRTEQSIINDEDIPDHEALGAYLGTYSVEGIPGEKTLLSPNKLPNTSVGALAYHYNSDEDTWTKIEDIEIDNKGYVWGTLEEFSPITVFALSRAAYYDTTKEHLPYNVFVCNGIPTKVYRNQEGTIIAEAGHIIQELTEDDSIVGGSYDGTPIETTDVFVKGVTLQYITAGSFTTGEDKKNHTKNAKLVVEDTTARCINGAGIWNCIDELTIDIKNTKITSGLGNQISFYQKKCSNKTLEDSDKGYLSNQYVKHSIITIKDSECYCAYSGGHSGHSTTFDAELYADNCKFEYACNGQSNGTIYNSKSVFSNCAIKYLNNNNRGHYGSGKLILNNSNTVEYGYIFYDPTEDNKEIADIRGLVSIDIDKDNIINDFCVGKISNVEITTAEEASKYIKDLIISRDAKITYTRNADIILKDIQRMK